MKSKLVLCAVACLVAATVPHLPAQETSRAEVYALEGLGALGGCVGCGLVAGAGAVLALWGTLDQPHPSALNTVGRCVMVVSAAALPAAVGYGAARAGEQLGEYGSTGWAIGGAYAGTFVGAGLAAIGGWLAGRNTYQRNWMSIPFYVVGGLAVPTGAVVGYNFGSGSDGRSYQPRFGGRLQPPALALTSVELPDGAAEYGVRVLLARLRF